MWRERPGPRGLAREAGGGEGGCQGGEPTSCKECKQRNKGALFCFKRGHMPYLVPARLASPAAPSPSDGPAEPRPSPPA